MNYLPLIWNILNIVFYNLLIHILCGGHRSIVYCEVCYMLDCIITNYFFLYWNLLKYMNFLVISNSPLERYSLYPLSSLHLLNLSFIRYVYDLTFRWNLWSWRSLELNSTRRTWRTISNLIARRTIRSREIIVHLLGEAHNYFIDVKIRMDKLIK